MSRSRAVPPHAIRLLRVRVPLVTSHIAAHGTESVREVVLVCWTRPDGTEGWGECPTLTEPGYVTETTDQAWRALVEELAPAAALTGLIAEPGTSADPGVLAAPAALADARLDAELRSREVPLWVHLGAEPRAIPRCRVLADLGASPRELAARAEAALAGGAVMVKVKIAPGRDVAPLREVIAATGDAAKVAADANGSYRDAVALEPVDRLGLRYLEQPFPPSYERRRLAELHRPLGTPVALDESLDSLEAVRACLDSGLADVVSVKAARLGGAIGAATAVELAAAAGVPAFVGGMLELGVGRAVAATVAMLPGCVLPTDLGPSSDYVPVDVCEPFVTDAEGSLVPPSGPGIGRTPDPELLARFTVDEHVVPGPR